jgi:hypothetical protein
VQGPQGFNAEQEEVITSAFRNTPPKILKDFQHVSTITAVAMFRVSWEGGGRFGSGKLLLALGRTVNFGFGFRGIHAHILYIYI